MPGKDCLHYTQVSEQSMVYLYIYTHIYIYIYIYIYKGKGIQFIVLYPPKCSHDLPPLAGTVHTETISIPRGIFQSTL